MVVTSITCTAPMLVDLLAEPEVTAEVARRNYAERARVTAEQIALLTRDTNRDVAGAEEKVRRFEDKVTEERRKLDGELAGHGLTVIPGWGTVSKQLAKDLAADEDDLAAARTARETVHRDVGARLATLREALERATDEELRAKFGANMVENTPSMRQKLVDELSRDRPEFARLALLAKLLLGTLCALFLTLKLIQPRAIHIYLNEHLQIAHQSYLKGRFDAWLLPACRSDGRTPMNPFEFDDFFQHRYPEVREAEYRLEEAREAQQAVEDARETIETTRATFMTKIERLRAQQTAVDTQLVEQTAREAAARARGEGLRRVISEKKAQLDRTCSALAATQSTDPSALVRVHDKIVLAIDEHARELEQVDVLLSKITSELERLRQIAEATRRELAIYQTAHGEVSGSEIEMILKRVRAQAATVAESASPKPSNGNLH
jgi:hypothetical protein